MLLGARVRARGWHVSHFSHSAAYVNNEKHLTLLSAERAGPGEAPCVQFVQVRLIEGPASVHHTPALVELRAYGSCGKPSSRMRRMALSTSLITSTVRRQS